MDRPARAIAHLEAGLGLAPANPQLWSDLAAARFLLAKEEDRPFDLVRGLGAADQALEFDPTYLPARFNRALALSLLGLRTGARAAWDDYLGRLPPGGLDVEAEEWVRVLSEPTAAESWGEDRRWLVQSALTGREGTVTRLVQEYPSGALDLAETDLLTGWAQAVLSNDDTEARRFATAFQMVAQILASRNGDTLLAEIAAELEGSRPPGPRQKLLAQGVLDYSLGVHQIADSSYDGAEETLSASLRTLDAAHSLLAERARFHLGIALYYRPDYEQARTAFGDVGRRISFSRHPILAAHTSWMAGLCRFILGRPGEMLRFYREALDSFERIGDEDGAAAVHTLLAQAYDFLGEGEEGWRHRYASLTLAHRFRTSRRGVALFARTGDAAADAGELRAALELHNEAVTLADIWGNALERLEAHRSRSRIHSRVGARESALDDLTRAWAASAELADEQLRENAEAEILRAEGDLPMPIDPREALPLQTKALAFFQRTQKGLYLAEAHATRAATYRAIGDLDQAEADLRAGISEIERQRAAIPNDELRLTHYAMARRQRIFDGLTELLAIGRRLPDKAFVVAARGRGRALRERRSPAGPSSEAPSLSSIRDSLPRDTALLFYVSLPKELLAWVISPQGVRFVMLATPARELEQEIWAFRDLIASRASRDAAVLESAGYLFDLLVRPILEEAPEATDLIIIPDKALHAVPFAGLYDADTGSYLVETHTLALAPTLPSTHDWGRPSTSSMAEPHSLLAVANPSFDRVAFPSLRNLPLAENEVRTVAAQYSQVTILIGDRADRGTFLRLLGEYDVVHYAGHAVANLHYPGQSALALASATGDSGAIHAYEVSALDLSHLRLVVLAACSTGNGPNLGGEGLMSLARAFLEAGADSVVSTLWEVDDNVGPDLFTSFHVYLRSGLQPAAALRQAQIAAIRSTDPATSSAATWSGLQLVLARPQLSDH